MDLLTAIHTRRSVRQFQPDAVPAHEVEILLRAAMQAPSAGNEQPWHFIVINERATLNAISAFHPYARMLAEAPLAICVCADLNALVFPGRWMLDCAAAMQNLLLAAHDRGLGAVWVGLYPAEERMQPAAELLALPAHVQPVALAAIGYAKSTPAPVDRFNPQRIHTNRW